MRIEIESGDQEVIHEDRRYLGHVNPSPTIVGDGTPAYVFTSESTAWPYIQLFSRQKASAWDGERYVGPKILAYHRSTFNDQHAHCIARFVRCALRRTGRRCCTHRI